jgi:hypothetical protein
VRRMPSRARRISEPLQSVSHVRYEDPLRHQGRPWRPTLSAYSRMILTPRRGPQSPALCP